jgi:hypothetical protein
MANLWHRHRAAASCTMPLHPGVSYSVTTSAMDRTTFPQSPPERRSPSKQVSTFQKQALRERRSVHNTSQGPSNNKKSNSHLLKACWHAFFVVLWIFLQFFCHAMDAESKPLLRAHPCKVLERCYTYSPLCSEASGPWCCCCGFCTEDYLKLTYLKLPVVVPLT